MTELDIIKDKITKLYETNPDIHMDVTIQKPKISLTNARAKIIGVYANIFRIMESSSGVPRSHTIQYVDVLTKNISIVELR